MQPIFKKHLIIIALVILTFNIQAQLPVKTINNDESTIEDKIENIAENTDAELDYTELVETLNYYKENPINLNNTNADELKKLLFLNDIQINDLLNYIANTGQLLSVYELQFVNGFSNVLIYKILPYIVVEQVNIKISLSFKDIFKFGRQSLLFRYQTTVENQLGYTSISDAEMATNTNQRYLGNALKIFTRYAFNYRDIIKFGITADKDPGEEFFKHSQPNGFDFYSVYIAIKNIGHLKSLVIGDFQAQFGQGLTLWTGLGFGKSSTPMSMKKYAQGIKPYSSANESGFLRGIGACFGDKNFDFTMFYSTKNADANIDAQDTLTPENLCITSIQESGYHRTPGELADKNTFKEKVFGTNISIKLNNFKIGATAYRTLFNTALIKDAQLYNQFEFQGKENTNAGIDYQLLTYPFMFFGEIAAAQNGGLACMSGLQASLDSRFLFSMIYRNYQKEYQNLKTAAFGENSQNANESGLFTGVEVGIAPKWTASAYVDYFSFPWLKYRVDAPSQGNEYLIKINYDASRRLEFYLQYREKNKQINTASALLLKYPEETKKQNLRFNVSYIVNDFLTLKNRIEWIKYQNGNSYLHNGFLIYQDISYKFTKLPLRLSARYAIFDTDTYEERLFAYESDLLYAFSIPSYYYKGSRFYLMLKYDVSKNIDIWLRYAVSYYNNKNVISSGLDQIQGSSKSDIKFQFMIKF